MIEAFLPPAPPFLPAPALLNGRWKAVSDVARREGVLLYRHNAVDSVAVQSSSGGGKGGISDKDVAMSWATELNTM